MKKKDINDLKRDLIRGRVSRREFVERAAEGALGIAATFTALSAAGQSQTGGAAHAHAPAAHATRHHTAPAAVHHFNQTNVNPFGEWLKEDDPVRRAQVS